MWAIFVVGHDCGHGSFSKYHLVNDVIGTFLHSLLLVPYYPWKLSHRHHHKNTCNIDKDEIFYPIRQRDVCEAQVQVLFCCYVFCFHRTLSTLLLTFFFQSSKDGGIEKKGANVNNSYILPLFGFGIGWLYYLVLGYNKLRPISHFNLFHPLFSKNVLGVALSLASFAAVSALLVWMGTVFGWLWLATYYGGPWFVFASWLVVTTFLHHCDIVSSAWAIPSFHLWAPTKLGFFFRTHRGSRTKHGTSCAAIYPLWTGIMDGFTPSPTT